MSSQISHSFINEKIAVSIVTTSILAALSAPANAGLLWHKDSSTSTTSTTATSSTAATPAGGAPTTGAAVSSSAPPSDYLAGADDRVNKAKTQLDTAKKQLSAAKALVKAAQAEYTAAQADRQALALKTTAQGLASESGLQSGTPTDTNSPNAASVTPAPAAATTPSAAQGGGTPGPNDFGMPDFSGGNTATTPGAPAATGVDPNTGAATLR
jgi:multidrug efflux pump subunit AcrA (membrane-fusion protein)